MRAMEEQDNNSSKHDLEAQESGDSRHGENQGSDQDQGEASQAGPSWDQGDSIKIMKAPRRHKTLLPRRRKRDFSNSSTDDSEADLRKVAIRTSVNNSANKKISLWVPVTPQMLVIAVKDLLKRRRPLSTESIADHIQRTFPVRHALQSFYMEVYHKLQCAVDAGVLEKCGDSYNLPRTRGIRMKLKDDDVSAFWWRYNMTREMSRKSGSARISNSMSRSPTCTLSRQLAASRLSLPRKTLAGLTPHVRSEGMCRLLSHGCCELPTVPKQQWQR